MKLISDYLLDLSEQHEHVAIPGLGTFHFTKVSAQLSGFTEFTPPGLKITFSSDFKADPDLFVNYVAIQEGKSKEDAAKFIQILVDGMLQELEQSKSLELNAIGTILMDDQGVIDFKGGAGRITNADTFGLGKLSTDLVPKAKGKLQGNNKQASQQAKQNTSEKEASDAVANLKNEPKKQSKKRGRLIRISLIILILFILIGGLLSYAVYLCHYEPEQLGVDICSKLEFLEPIAKQFYQSIKK